MRDRRTRCGSSSTAPAAPMETSKQLVRADGVEGALAALYRAGVYLTADEVAGRCRVVRGSDSFDVDPADLRNPGPSRTWSATAAAAVPERRPRWPSTSTRCSINCPRIDCRSPPPATPGTGSRRSGHPRLDRPRLRSARRRRLRPDGRALVLAGRRAGGHRRVVVPFGAPVRAARRTPRRRASAASGVRRTPSIQHP